MQKKLLAFGYAFALIVRELPKLTEHILYHLQKILLKIINEYDNFHPKYINQMFEVLINIFSTVAYKEKWFYVWLQRTIPELFQASLKIPSRVITSAEPQHISIQKSAKL